jgi:hypothetical protein
VKYDSGLETCENFIPLSEGGLARRPGTRYVAEAKSSSVKGRLKRFQFSTTQSYILEMGATALRFFKDQGQITVATTTAAVTNGDFASNITNWDDRSTGAGSIAHDATNGRLSLIPGGSTASDIGWAEQDITTGTTGTVHVIKFRVIGSPGDKVQFRVGTGASGAQTLADVDKEVGYHVESFTPTTSPFYIGFRCLGTDQNKTVQIDDVSIISNAPVDLTTPYAEADLYSIEGPQSADVLYFLHSSYPSYKLQRFGDASWSFVEVNWDDGPYLTQNTSATTLLPSAATGLGINLTLSAITGVNDNRGWLSTDIGRLVRYQKGGAGAWGTARIVSITSTTVAVADVNYDFQATPTAAASFRLGAWSGTTGYPQQATFYEQRTYVAATTEQPQTFWASQTADFENFRPDDLSGTVEDDDALDFTLSADNVNAIRWLSAGEDTLAIGTSGGEWVPSSVGAVLTPNDITVRRQTTFGSAQIAPHRVGSVVLFVQRAKRKIRELGFSFENDGFRAPDMTRLSGHISFGGLVEIDFAQERESLVLAVRGDGQLLSMTYRREEDVVGWARWIIGGSFSTGNAVVESVRVISGDNGAGQVQDSTDRDEIWVLVKRTINGATKRYIEVFERGFETGHDQEDAYFADSLITYDGSSATVLTGLDHLEGETVKIWADGAIQADKTVASGSITLDTAASVVQMGLGYTHKGKFLKLSAGNPSGTSVGKIKRYYGVVFIVENSHILKYGPSSSDLTEFEFREVSTPMDAGAPLFTGEQFVEFNGDYDTDVRIVIESDAPAPFTLLAFAPEMIVNALK